MFFLVLVVHILVCFALMAVVLMQSGKGRGLSGAFGGGGGNQTIFGGRGAVDFLGKATWVLGGAFMVTSLTLAMISSGRNVARGGESLIKKSAASAPAGGSPGEPAGSPTESPMGGPGGGPAAPGSGSSGSPLVPRGTAPGGAGTAQPSTPPAGPGGGGK